jgi:hypothetical protein
MLLGFLTISLNVLYIQLHKRNKKTNGKHQKLRKDKQGRVVHREINKVTQEDIGGLQDDALPPYDPSISYEMAKIGRELFVDLLVEAGVTAIDNAVLQRLPTIETIQHLYGSGPVLIGMETCQQFRNMIPSKDASLAVAGLFNTGTNLMSSYLESNCYIPHNTNRNKGMRWQVPWGKHMLANNKWNNTAQKDQHTNKTNVMPVVVVRDPYSWMQSMCRTHYAVMWHHTSAHCPNLVPNDEDYKLYPFPQPHIPVRLNFKGHAITKYDSLAHLWSEWYQQYMDADYPRIIVRYEDLMYYPRQVTQELCTCVGGEMKNAADNFVYMVDSAKWGPGHGRGEKTSLVAAMIRYGNEKKRLRGYTMDDLQLAHVALKEDLMELFHYNRPLE